MTLTMMKKKTPTVFAALLAVTAAGWAATAEADDVKVRIATEGAYAPWNSKNASGDLIGFDIDLAQDLCRRMAAECTIVEQAWDGIIPALQAGKYDAIMAGMSITDERKKAITFSRAYAATPQRFVVLESSPSAGFSTELDNLNLGEVSPDEQQAIAAIVSEFKGKVIGVQIATTHENFLRAYFEQDVSIRTYDTQENLDLDLQAGRIDAALASMSYWATLLASDKGKGLKTVGPNMIGGPLGAGIGAGFRKEDQKLADRFSDAISAAIADGTLSRLAMQWFGFDASAKP